MEYETGLEEVLKLRKAAYGIKAAPGRAELGGVRRCHVVFERATKKYKGDLRLWLAWMDFCKASGSTRQMSKARHSYKVSEASDKISVRQRLPVSWARTSRRLSIRGRLCQTRGALEWSCSPMYFEHLLGFISLAGCT